MGVVVLWCTLSLLLLLSWLGSLSQHEREVMNAPPKKIINSNNSDTMRV